jgi:predicted  nucleic acid-binding Zn-ribbon protein
MKDNHAMEMVISKIEEEILTVALRRQRDQMTEMVEAMERRDMTVDEIKESLKHVENRLRDLRKRGSLTGS